MSQEETQQVKRVECTIHFATNRSGYYITVRSNDEITPNNVKVALRLISTDLENKSLADLAKLIKHEGHIV